MKRSPVILLLVLLMVFCAQAQSKKMANGRFTVQSYADNIIKVTFTPNDAAHRELVSDAVILKPQSGKNVDARWNDSAVILNKGALSITYHGGDQPGFSIPLQANEMIFGGGERALSLNRRGYRLNLYNNPWYGYGEGADNLNYSVPFVTSSAGYGLFFDNPSRSYIDIGKSDPERLVYGASSGQLNVYVIFGDYQEILRSYYRLTGTQPLPPRWAFGNLMSRFGYSSETQVEGILGQMKAQSIPVDAVIFDLFWFGDSIKGTLGNLEWMNKNAWPDPTRMIAQLKKDKIQTILVTEPFLVETSKNYAASKPYLAVDSAGRPYYLTDFYFGHGGLVDIFRKDAQQWFWKFYKRQMDRGVEAWWGDLGEPERHPSNLYHNLRDLGQKRLFAADEVHNLYGHTWTKMLFTQYAKDFPDKRLFSLNRSGFAGSQRYSIFPWTGDVSRSWSGFRAQLPVLLGMSMSGVPYVHSDAGGFAGGDGDGELYVRWLQFAAFTPIFRPHGTALYEKDTAAFSFPSEAALVPEPYRGDAKAAILTRYTMLPYNYTLAYEQARNGKPLMAPLYFYWPHDTAAAHVNDEYMWGDAILCMPVLQKGARERAYYLPEGKWMRPDGSEMLSGGHWQTDTVSLQSMPMMIREGAFVPVAPHLFGNTAAYDGSYLKVTYATSAAPSSYTLYSDDGRTKGNIEKKQYELLRFSSQGMKGAELRLSISSDGGHYARQPAKRKILMSVYVARKPAEIRVNGRAQQQVFAVSDMEKPGTYIMTSDHMCVSVIEFTGQPLDMRFRWSK